MALIKCSECGTEVSDRADKCPKCACPVDSPLSPKTQVIEQTSKKLKLQLIIGVVFALLALPAGFFLNSSTIAYVFFIIGAVIIISTKALIWWRHH